MSKHSKRKEFEEIRSLIKPIAAKDIPPIQEIMRINSFSELDRDAFKKKKELDDYEFEKQRKEDSYKLRRRVEYGVCICGGLVVIFVLIASFFAVMEWINNSLLKALFITIMGCFISTVVGFALGIFYQKSK